MQRHMFDKAPAAAGIDTPTALGSIAKSSMRDSSSQDAASVAAASRQLQAAGTSYSVKAFCNSASVTAVTSTAQGVKAPSVSAALPVAEHHVVGHSSFEAPRARRRTLAGAIATKHAEVSRRGTTIAASAAESEACETVKDAPVIAAATGSADIGSDNVSGDGSASAVGTAAVHAVSEHSSLTDAAAAVAAATGPFPATHFVNGGRDFVNSILNRKNPQISKAVNQQELNMPELVAKGEECWAAILDMKHTGCARFDLGRDNPGCKEQKPFKSKNKKMQKTYMWKLSVVLNEGGQELTEQEWEARNQSLDAVMTSHEVEDETFEAGLAESAVIVKSIYREQNGGCWAYHHKESDAAGATPHAAAVTPPVTGGGPCRGFKDASNLAAFRQAVFRVTIVMILLWHSQGRSVHPSLQKLVDKYKLRAVPIKRQKPQTSTAIMKGEALRALEDTVINNRHKQQKSGTGNKRRAAREAEKDEVGDQENSSA